MRAIYFLWILLPVILISLVRFALRLFFWGGIQRMLTLVALGLFMMVWYYVQN
ncbi:MAG: hypothetical protein V4534_03810 [Myxococcota bacterium]